MKGKESLFNYRSKQAFETLKDAKKMLDGKISPRSIVNRAYYSMFYAVLALFLKTGVKLKTSKHSGVISIFDREFVHTGKLDKSFSKMLHKIFDLRQECDYREHVDITIIDAKNSVGIADEFLKGLKQFFGSGKLKAIKTRIPLPSEE